MAGRHTTKDNTAFPRNSVDANRPYGQPGSEKGSRTINQHTSTPTSIQDIGKSKFASISSRDSGCERGQVDSGDGTGIGGKRP